MLDHNESMIQFHLSNAKNKGTQKNILFVFKGFDQSFYNDLSIEKLLSYSTEVSIQQLADSRAHLYPEVFSRISPGQKSVFWVTFEEFITLGRDILSLYFEIIMLKNNLYHQTFPILYPIDNIDEIYQRYYHHDEWPDNLSAELEILQTYFGDIKKVDNQYYVTYATEMNDLDFYVFDDLDQLPEDVQSVYEEAYLELSEEEDQILQFIHDVTQGKITGKVVHITYSGELNSFPNNYYNRLTLLQYLYKEQVQLVLSTKKLEPKRVYEEEYLKILKRYWGYDSFRLLKMYKNINNPSNKKETILVSQSQIIDDIIKQAEKSLNKEDYNDIFVTSPTGAGKSIMFQIPAIYLAHKYNLMTIVISPLIGLMTDQVQGLQNKNVDISATINSELTPVEKLDIMEKIKQGNISILYISPETLLSRSDISQLIGERKVGLFVIDETHIVTTWGKAFRSDYWYLGGYLQKLRKEMQFPIATFTATAIYGGVEDMYAETRDSLNLINPISYFGYIKRDDIEVKIRQKDLDQQKYKEYLSDKFKILLVRLETFLQRGQKTLVYFPTVRLILDFIQFARVYGSTKLISNLSCYYGSMEKEDKNINYLKYKNNETNIMLATKAFGMGIDIPDIQNVYHFAPTGNVCDYIQEIGRAARSLNKGYAYFDFLPKDFVHVNRLHGISTLKKHQLIQVMEKILKLAEKSKESSPIRNLLVRSDEFRYIFEKKNVTDQVEDIDNKLKTALLIIEKDFKLKMNYSPIVARPRSIFANEYFLVDKEIEDKLMKQFGRYFTLVRKKQGKEKSVYKCNLKNLWQDHYTSLSYPQFKYLFHSKDESLKLFFLDSIQSVLLIDFLIKTSNITQFKLELQNLVGKVSNIFGKYARNNQYFSIEEFAKELKRQTKKDKYYCENLAMVCLYSAENFDRLTKKHANFYNSFIRFDEGRKKYTLLNSSYSDFLDWVNSQMKLILSNRNTSEVENNRFEMYLSKENRKEIEKTFILLGLVEAMGLLIYSVTGGDNPEIYIRINSFFQLYREVNNPTQYENRVLTNVYERHKTSVEMLTYLFKNEVSTKEFWELIEDYFLGKIPEEVSMRLKTIS